VPVCLSASVSLADLGHCRVVIWSPVGRPGSFSGSPRPSHVYQSSSGNNSLSAIMDTKCDWVVYGVVRANSHHSCVATQLAGGLWAYSVA